MEGRATYIRVGLLILAGAALLVGLVWFLGGNKITKGILHESYFSESVQGLEVGVPVKYRGVTVGRVTEIGLVSAEYGPVTDSMIKNDIYRLVFVRYLIDNSKIGREPDTKAEIDEGLRARLATTGLTGTTYIELDFVDPARYPAKTPPWKPKADHIPSMPTTLTQVEDATKVLLEHLSHIDLVKLAQTATSTLNSINQLVTQISDAVKVADVPGLIADLRQTSTAVRTLAEDRDIQRTLAGTAQAAERLSQIAAQLPPLINALQATTRRTDNTVADTQQALTPALRDILAVTSNLREVTDSLRRNPAQLFVGEPPPRQQEPRR